jgi:hypothetical protein
MITNKMKRTRIAPVDVKAPTADIGLPPLLIWISNSKIRYHNLELNMV